MKRFLPILFSVALTAVCCTKEPITDQSAEIVFAVALDNVAVKAAGDASRIDQLEVKAFDRSGAYLDYIQFTCSRTDNTHFTARGRLVRGVEYTLLFFAQKKGTYSVGNDGKLAIDGFGATSEEARDAFYAVQKVVPGDAKTESVNLTRPFALLRFVSSAEDQSARTLSGEVRSQVVLDKIPNSINLLTGAVSGSVKATLDASPRPSASEVAFAFVPAGENKQLISASVTVTASGFSSVRNIGNVPVRRNCETTLRGDFYATEGVLDIDLNAN